MLSVQKILNVTGSNPNPHIWYDTAQLPQVASAISGELGKLDPADAATFTANAQTFDTSLQPITTVIGQIKAKYTGTKIAYTERVPGYLVQAAGLVLGVPASFTQAVEDGTDPSPKDTAAFAFKKGGVAAVEVAGPLGQGGALLWAMPPGLLRRLARG